MQKFTVFSILLSLSVILIIGDIVFHDYLGEDAGAQEFFPSAEESMEDENLDSEAAPSEEEVLDETSVELSEDASVGPLPSTLSSAVFTGAGFMNPVLKDTLFSGLIFQLIEFPKPFVYQWNVFDGEQYVGTVYEIKSATETASFQSYLGLREGAQALSTVGEVNEVNNYGDASFYFNHKSKTKTIHLVMRSRSDVYAFEYAQLHHEKMKKVFDNLGLPL